MTPDYIFLTGKMRMSTKSMADTMYALVTLKAFLTSHFFLGKGYTRKQSSTFMCDIVVKIKPTKVFEFEAVSTSGQLSKKFFST